MPGLLLGIRDFAKRALRGLAFFAFLLTAPLAPPAQAGGDAAARFVVTYSVSDRAVTVFAAVTPYDADAQVRNAFLHWFKRGFDTVLAGEPPLMIEWDSTPKAMAGRRGYDFGMDEAERFLKRKAPGQAPYTVPIPPG